MLAFASRGAGVGALAIALLTLPAVASAQVLEIDAAGQVTTYDGPTLFRADGSAEAMRTPRWGLPSSGAPGAVTQPLVAKAASSADLSPDLVEAVGWRESRGQPRAVSSAGAVGQMQLMPRTARALGVDPRDPEQNLFGGARYLKSLMRRYNGNLVLTLAAYNAGPGAVDKYGGVPPFRETRDYVSAILGRLSWRALSQQGN